MIIIDGRAYVPFAPFPALVLAPLVALVGPVTADQMETGVNAFLAAAWWAWRGGRAAGSAWRGCGTGWRSC